jgi:hypothetical protein
MAPYRDTRHQDLLLCTAPKCVPVLRMKAAIDALSWTGGIAAAPMRRSRR